MLKKISENLINYSYLAELFLIVSSIFLLFIFLFLKYKSIVKPSTSKILGHSIVFIFLMATIIYFNELLFLSNHNQFWNTDFPQKPVFFKDVLGIFIGFLICLFWAAFFFIIVGGTEKNQELRSESLLLLYFSVIGLPLFCTANDLLSYYLIIEITLSSAYFLAVYEDGEDLSYFINVGLKYFIMGSIFSAFFIVGSFLIYADSDSLYFLELHNLLLSIDLEYSANYAFKSNGNLEAKFSLEKNINDYIGALSSKTVTEDSFDGVTILAHSAESVSSEKATWNTSACCSCPSLSEIQKKFIPHYVPKSDAASIKDKMLCDALFESLYQTRHPLKLIELNEHNNASCEKCEELIKSFYELLQKCIHASPEVARNQSHFFQSEALKLLKECAIENEKCEAYKMHINELNKKICEEWCAGRQTAYIDYFYDNYKIRIRDFYFDTINKSKKP